MTGVRGRFGAVIRAAVLIGLLSAPTSYGRGELRLSVDLSARELYVHHSSITVDTFAIAVGQPGHRTPVGEFAIDRIIWNPRWVPPASDWAKDAQRKEPGEPDNPMQGAKLFFKYPAYYIHGTNEPESIGTAASHGCIRMMPHEVERLARLVQQHGGAPRDDAWYERMIRSDKDRQPVDLPVPVPLSIEP